MRKTVATLLVVLGLTLIVVAFSVKAFPQWLSLPGGILMLLAGAFTGVAGIASKLKDWREFLFGDQKAAQSKTKSQAAPAEKYSVDIRNNLMVGKTRIGVHHDDVRIAENPMLGETEIEVGQPSQKSTRKKGKKRK